MAVTPNDILEKRFERSFRGYDEDQVDAFLDAVKEELENRIEENKVLCDQIVGFEDEIQNLKIKMSEMPEASGNGENTDEMIESARHAAEKYIAEAKQTAESIIAAATRKAEEAVEKASEKIKAMYTKAVSAQKSDIVQTDSEDAVNEIIDRAKQQAFKMINDAKGEAESIRSKAAEYADRIMQDTDNKSKAFLEQKIAEVKDEVERLKAQYQREAVEGVIASAKEKADEIIRHAEEKAEQTKNMMNIQIANAQKRLEDIHHSVEKYKAKLEDFVQNQTGILKGFDDEEEIDPGAGLNKAAAAGLAGKMNQGRADIGGIGIDIEDAAGLGEDSREIDYTDQIFTHIDTHDSSITKQENGEILPVEKLVTMASQEGTEEEIKKKLNDVSLAFSEAERKELEDLLDELL